MVDDLTKRDRDDVIFNKRQDTRIGAELEVSFAVSADGPHNFFTAMTQDISTGGIFLATLQILPIGAKMHVSFTLEEREITADAEVRWVREPSPSLVGVSPGMGLRFVEIADVDRDFIEVYIKQIETIYYDDNTPSGR